ncbi:MAG: hypothetical protein B7Z37_03050 [Verrucomicrobia bacterium 12-59-8]|nr:MAG: hypothetical protein B7Z37_03050 [Verrucomicrobia bacterium 12-59-8]
MPIIHTQSMDPTKMHTAQKLWVYNALDALVTFEVRDALIGQMDPVAKRVYDFSKSLQAPVLAMMRKGFRVDLGERQKTIDEFDKRAAKLQRRLDQMTLAIWGKILNPRSPAQCISFFYDFLKLPAVHKTDKKTKVRKRTVDRDALEKLGNYYIGSIFVSHILTIRELTKLASTLRTELDGDRMRCSFNIAGTETGRFSSSASAFDTGTNLQNQTERLRRIYVADPGHKLAVFDLKTGESFAVGLKCHLLGLGRRYLDACFSGDLHTEVTKLVWPGLPWSSGKTAKEIAEQVFYRHFTYRDMAKRGGHGTNYYGTPPTMAKHLKVDTKVVEAFQTAYFKAFPEIREWHTWTAGELQTKAELTSIMGRRRHFFGRVRDDNTLREAIAYDPQSCIADYTNTWLRRVYENVRACDILQQGHDALVVQYRADHEREVVEQIIYEASQVRLGGDHPDGFPIPAEAKIGWNWGKIDPKHKMHSDGNPFGLKDYSGKDDREYIEPPSNQSRLLDRKFSR